jgi:hypothetical protein
VSRWCVVLLYSFLCLFSIETRKKTRKRKNKGQKGCILVSDRVALCFLWPMGLSHTENGGYGNGRRRRSSRRDEAKKGGEGRSFDGGEGGRELKRRM